MIRSYSLVAYCALLVACGAVEDGQQVRVTISPESPTTTDDLVATIQGGSGLAFRWSVNGGVRQDTTTNRIAASLTTKHEVWKVEAVQGDTAVASAEVTIANAPPSLPTVAAPTSPIAAAPIQCTLSGTPADPDGDPVQLTVSWTLNGAPFTGTTTTVVANDTIPALASHTGNVFECTVTVSDAETPATATATATVAPRLAYLVQQDVTPQKLRTIDLDTGMITDVATLDVPVAFGDLAWDRVGQKLYMIDGRGNKGLYTVNTSTGATTLIGTHGLTDAFALGFDPADANRLYLVTAPGTGNSLYRVSPVTGAVGLVANLAGNTSRMEGLAFDSKRNLFVGATTSGTINTINPITGALVQVGTTAGMNDFGMTYDPFVDKLWAVDVSGRLISIDPNQGYASTIVAQNIGLHPGIAIVLPPP
ncbi:MAG TPA: hypothetical protein VN253_06575 [Kofleriaceae bacterium]|nr:hypothetical protein [Kofleriaceae bacterium]